MTEEYLCSFFKQMTRTEEKINGLCSIQSRPMNDGSAPVSCLYQGNLKECLEANKIPDLVEKLADYVYDKEDELNYIKSLL